MTLSRFLGVLAAGALLSGHVAIAPATADTGSDWRTIEAGSSVVNGACQSSGIAYGGGSFMVSCYSPSYSGPTPATKINRQMLWNYGWLDPDHVVPPSAFRLANKGISLISTGVPVYGYTDVAYGDGVFVAVSPLAGPADNSGSKNFTSARLPMVNPPGGAVNITSFTWTPTDVKIEGARAVAFGGSGLFVTVGYSGAAGVAARSTNSGTSWTAQPVIPAGQWQSIAYGKGLFVAVSADGKIMTSSDGTNSSWTLRSSPVSGNLRKVIYGDGMFVAVCSNCGTSSIITSPDGLSWSARTTPNKQWNSVAVGSGFGVNPDTSSTGLLYVAVGPTTTGTDGVMTSSDGVTWKLKNPGGVEFTGNWTTIGFGNGRFIVAADQDADAGWNSPNANAYGFKSMGSGSFCGDGVPYSKPSGSTTQNWLMFAMPCVAYNRSTISEIIGPNLSGSSYFSDWIMYRRTDANTGNEVADESDEAVPSRGYWFGGKGSIANNDPKDGKLAVGPGFLLNPDEACFPNPGIWVPGRCQSFSVNTTSVGARMFGNPFAFDVDLSSVRVRVDGTIKTLDEAYAANELSNQIWIWAGGSRSGGSYVSYNTTTDVGSLKYSQSFFVRVLPGGVGKTISLLVPYVSAGNLTGAALQSMGSQVASLSVDGAAQGLRAAPANAGQPKNWTVKLRLRDSTQPAGSNEVAKASLGQFVRSSNTFDIYDMVALAPSWKPFLTMVFPKTGWGANTGDYVGDFRPSTGAKGDWPFEIRADKPGATVVLKWEGNPEILKRSRLTDLVTGKVIDPTSKANANGYTFKLTTTVRKMKWSYLGDAPARKSK